MEQAINLFNKGLLIDTCPMVQGNDTLTDCLNGTIITMSGNEIVLQNDMGNRRVDNAYLPSGYEPVGMKEYGGIIYIAAYNPITNRSLIGSFPSPERRISKNDGLTSSIDFVNGFVFSSDNSLGINCLKEDTLLFPLTKDTSLHAGDKFIVYGGLDEQSKISNFDNVDGSKVKSPKNKQYTLALGILNSENLFVDITSSLVRWNGDSIMDLDDKTDLYKFNAGYFIKSSEPSSSDEILTGNDLLLTEERENAYQIMKANTYSYKLVGPLYLQVRYNHILNFSYNIYGTYDKITKKAELFIEGFITYNCPDGLESGEGSDSNYSTYAEGEVSENFGFDFMVNEEVKTSSFLEEIKRETKYNSETNLYLVKIVKKISDLEPEGNLINYTIGVKANLDEGEYLYGLSSKGSIDVTKLGSGEIELTGWRFTNNYGKKSGTITYTLDAYPKYNEEFRNFKIKFENVLEDNVVEFISPVNNGKTNLNITWSPDKTSSALLWDRALYRVEITYDIYNKTTEDVIEESKLLMKKTEDGEELEVEEFYLTTELFNSCYSPNSSDFIADYGYPDGKTPISEYEVPEDYNPNDNSAVESDDENDELENRIKKIIYKKLVIIPNITTSSKLQESSIKEGKEGSLIHMSDEDYDITTTYTKDINVTFTVNLDANEILYPDYIKVKHELEEGDFRFTDETPVSNIDELSEIQASEEEIDKTIWNKYISVLKWKDSITVKNRKLYEGPMTNVFDSFYNYINSQTNYDFLSHSGIVLLSEGVWGPDHHGIYVTIDLDSPIANAWPNQRNNGEIMIMEHSEDLDSNSRWQEAKKLFNLSEYDLQDYFSTIKEEKVFAFVGLEGNDNSRISQRPPAYKEDIGTIPGYYVREYARIMWKSTTGWAYIDIPSPIKIVPIDTADSLVKNYLMSGDLGDIFKKIYYRRFKTLDSSSSGKEYYVPKGLDYEPYSKMFTLKYKVSLEENKGIEIEEVDPVLLNFKIVDVQKDEEKTVDIFLIQSGENFVDLINSEFSFNRCVLEDGAIADSDGNEFLVGNIYVKGNDDKYHKVEDSFPIKPYNTDQNESFLVCVSNKGSLKLQCDFRMDDDADSISWATYDVVDRISLDDLKLRINAY